MNKTIQKGVKRHCELEGYPGDEQFISYLIKHPRRLIAELDRHKSDKAIFAAIKKVKKMHS